MKQPCCPGMNNSRGAHIHLSTRQIWGEGPGQGNEATNGEASGPRPGFEGRVEGVVAVVEERWQWWCRVAVLCSISGRWMVRWLLAWAQSLKCAFKLTDCHLNQPACVVSYISGHVVVQHAGPR